MADDLPKKAVIAGIRFYSPVINNLFKGRIILNFSISIREYSGAVNDEIFTLRFHKVLLNPEEGAADISVEPAVDLVPGKTFCIIVEVHFGVEINWQLICV